ncbi:MAG TPA: DUF1761 domain-containing protein [Chitinophagales bacterium]|nr:DUF1761 domain-containing protein [Chitinophagales bacterium]
MQLNMLLSSLIASIIPLLVGFIWYNPKVFGTAWMNACGLEESKLQEGFNMPLVFGLCILFGFFISFGISSVVIHQFGFFGMLQHQVEIKNPEALSFLQSGFEKYGNEFRTFKHGALHGTILGITVALPIVGIGALFERRGWKYIAINAGYWILTLALMGGFICQFSKVSLEMFQ